MKPEDKLPEDKLPEDKLRDMGHALPEAAAAVANYVPFTPTDPKPGDLVHISGQISKIGDAVVTGRLGEDLTLADGRRAAEMSALNLLAQMKRAAGSLENVEVLKLGGFVCSLPTASGAAIPQIINGASDLIVEVLGERGRHARAAVSAPALPLDVAVEIDAVIRVL